MDKKLLVSLMMTAPVAIGAQAAGYETIAGSGDLSYKIQAKVDASNWKANGIADYKTDANGVLNCPVQTGYLTHDAKLTCIGEYTFSAVGCDNVYFKVGNEIQYKKNAKGEYLDADNKVTTDLSKRVYAETFTVFSDGTGVTITVLPKDKDLDFKIGTASIELNFKFADVKTALSDNLATVNLIPVTSEDDRVEAKNLRTRYEALVKDIENIKKDIATINLDNGAALADAYNTLNLQNYTEGNDKVSKAIAALKGNAGMANAAGKYPEGSYNYDADLENNAWDNIKANEKNLAALNTTIAELKTALNGKKNFGDDIDADTEASAQLKLYCEKVLSSEFTSAEEAIKALETAVKNAYPTDKAGYLPTTLVSDAKFKSDATTIKNNIAAIDYTNAKNDWNAYNDFMADLKNQAFRYATIFGKINNDYRVANYFVVGAGKNLTTQEYTPENVYDDVTGLANNALAEKFGNNEGYPIKKGAVNDKGELVEANIGLIKGAYGKYGDAKADMEDRLKEMNATISIVADPFNDQQAQLNGKDYQYADGNVNSNTPYGAGSANAIIAGVLKTYNSYVDFKNSEAFKLLNDTDKTKIEGLISDMAEAIAALASETNDLYVKHELDTTKDPFVQKLTDVTTADNAYKTYLAGLGDVVDLLVNFNNLEKYVADQTATVKDYSEDLSAKFDSSIKNIKDAIDKYYTSEIKDTDAPGDIKKAITEVEKACKKLVDGFNGALAAIGVDDDALKNFTTQLDTKKLIATQDNPAYNKNDDVAARNAFAATIANYKSELTNIAKSNDNVQEVYEKAIKETEKVKAAELYKAINTACDKFVKAATNKNSANVGALINYINKMKNTEPSKGWAGMDKVDLVEDVEGGFSSVVDLYNTQNSLIAPAGADVDKLNDIDIELEKIKDACAGVLNKINNVVANRAAYDRLVGNKADLSDAMDLYLGEMGTLTVAPALGHYMSELSNLKNELTPIEAAYEESYNEVTEVVDEKTHQDSLDEVERKFKNLKDNVLANQKNYVDLSNTADRISDQINKDNEILADLDQSLIKDILKTIKDITEELGHLNDEVTATFGEGGLTKTTVDSDYADYKARYDELTNKLNSAFDNWADNEYRSAVDAANKAWLSDHNLGEGENNVNSDYVEAVAYVNEYLYDLNNATYRKLITENEIIKANHNQLQQCYKQIEILNDLASKWLAALTPDKKEVKDYNELRVLGFSGNDTAETINGLQVTENLIMNATIEANGYNGVNTILKTIKDCKEAIDAEAMKLDSKFWNENGVVAKNTWDTIKSRLADAGFTTTAPTGQKSDFEDVYGAQYSVLTTMIASQAQGLAAIATATNEEEKEIYTHKYILDMDKWADMMEGNLVARSFGSDEALLPGFNPTTDALDEYIDNHVFKAVKGLWFDKSSSASTELNKLNNEIEGYKLDPKFDANKEKVENAIDALATLNTQWSRLTDSQKEQALPTYLDNLANLLKDANKAVSDAKAGDQLVNNNNEVYNKVIKNADSPYALALKDLNWLYNWSSYRPDQIEAIDEYAAALEAAKNAVIASTKDNTTTTATVADATKIIQKVSVNQFEQVCEDVYGDEYSYIAENLVLLRSAFNNVKLAGTADDQLEGWDADIKAIIADYDKAGYNAKDKVGSMNILESIEARISELLVVLQEKAQSVAPTDTKASTLEGLGNSYKASLAEINAFNTSVDEAKEEGKAEYVTAAKENARAEIQKLTEKLNAIKANYVSDGDNVIQHADEYAYQMAQLDDETAEAVAAWTNAYANALKKDISVDQYGILKAQLEELWNNTLDAVAEANSHRDTYDVTYYTWIDQQINGDEENGITGALDYYENLNKTFDVTRQDNVNNIANVVGSFVRNTLEQVAGNQQSYIEGAISGLINAVRTPDDNANGFAQAYFNAGEIIAALEDELSNAQNLSLDPIVRKYVNSRPVSTTPTEAFDAYNTIMETLDGYAFDAGQIKDKADKENLIVPGDVNDDDKVNILDVQKLIDDIAKGAEYTEKQLHTADVNIDGDLNVGDVTTLIKMVMGDETVEPENPIVRKLRSFMPAAFSGSNSYNVYEVQGENGMRRFAVLLTNETAFAAGQIDIKLPSHASVAGVSLGERANGLDAYTSDNGDYTRVVFTSLDNTMIEGNNGCVLFIDVEGNAEVEVENVIFSDKNGNAYKLNSNGESGVGILDSMKDGVKAIYNAAGQKLNKLTKGVNIIRNADGTTTKKMGK